MQSKIYYTYKADGEWEKRDGNNAKLYQGQVAATTYYLTVTEESGENWLPSDRVYIVFSRPDNPLSSVERRMDYDDVNKWWYIISDGWETDVDIADNVDSVPLNVSFVARRYSTTGNPVLIKTRTTGCYTETIYKSGTFYPQEIQEPTVVEYIESTLDEHSERLDTIDGQIVDLDERIAIAEGAANSFTFYKQLSDISGINPATVTPVELATAMATNSILATEITAETAPNLCPGGLTMSGSLFVRKSGADSVVFNYDAKLPETTTIYHYTGNVRLSDTSNQWSEWSDSSGAKAVYDKIITNDDEFYELWTSPTWLDAESVAFIGNFVRHSEISIPSTVKRIDGFNATISFINFNANSTGLLRPVNHGCSISGITLYCERAPIESQAEYVDAEIVAFANIKNISNCSATYKGEGKFVAFKNCDGGGNNYAKMDSFPNDITYENTWPCRSSLYVNCKNMHDCYGDAYLYGDLIGGGGSNEDVTAQARIFEECENMTNIGGTSIASSYVAYLHQSDYNAAAGCVQCKNISNITLTVTGKKPRDVAYGLRGCENVLNANVTAECLGDYGYAAGMYDCDNIVNCVAAANVPDISTAHSDAYKSITGASCCYPLIDDTNSNIDPSAGGNYLPLKPNNSDSLITYEGKINEVYLPEITNTDAVTGVKGNAEETYRIGDVNITADNVGLGNVDNTSDANKPVSTAQQTAIDTAVATTVQTSGAQTIGGAKTFTDNVTVSKASPYIFLKHSTDEYNVTPSSNLFSGIEITDKNGVYTGGFRGFRNTDGSTYAHIVARNQSNAAVSTGLRGYADGTWTFLPSTNNIVDIGTNAVRYKDLYLAGNINAAGTITGNVVNSPYKLIASGTLAAGASLTLNSLILGNNLNGRMLYLRIYGNDIAGGQFRLNSNQGNHFMYDFDEVYIRTDKTAEDTENERYDTFKAGELIAFSTVVAPGTQLSTIEARQSDMNALVGNISIDYQTIFLSTKEGQIPTATFYNADTTNPLNYQLYSANY